MRRDTRTKQRLWRWRSNPLRRRDDAVEAWIVLAVWTGIALGGTLAGLVAGHAVAESFAQQRAGRHSVPAVLLENTPAVFVTEAGPSRQQVRAKVRWTAADGSTHTGRAKVDTGHKTGSKVRVWTDDQGQLTSEPATAAQATVFAGYAATAAALGVGGVTYAVGRVARGRLDRRRIDQWGREWDQVGPQWIRKTT
ncbi:Rv1733c family protein [Streptomyces flaveus]|uniref:Uncharacterized protein n=1 Tax=Streptomyces flaveus TaxID=66370 RepID=A0A917RN23_9ACTN|nr:hypothetical protein [Streptomyces flaveus]GGL16497.1 hypothetical protein GCM10010094_91690 [Streptomyces flaveus]